VVACHDRAIIELVRRITAVVNKVKPSEAVVNTHRPLCLQHLWYDAKVEEQVGQFFLAFTLLI